MTNQLFRKKSIDKISSPEKLDDYLKVSTPSLWLVLLAVISLLLGIIVWSSVSELETTISAVASVNDNKVEIILTGNDAEVIDSGMQVRIGNYETTIDYVQYDDLGRAIALCDGELSNGNYKAEIITERVHPIEFLFK